MKKAVVTLVIIFVCLQHRSFCQDTINWRPGYTLTWNDFKAAPIASSQHWALTHSVISYTYTYSGAILHAQVSCYFDKNLSWKKPQADDALMAHERGHFDIAEIFAKKLQQAFDAYKITNFNTIDKDLKNIFDTIMRQVDAMQQQYDQETQHSINKPQQQAWLDKIKGELSK